MGKTPRAVCSGRAWVEATTPYRLACALDQAPCALCHQPIDYTLRWNHKRAFTIDHIHALHDGGHPLDRTNWQPAHRSCNSARGAREANRKRAMNRPKPIYYHRRTDLTW